MSNRPRNIVSIQSHVAYGHVGNSAAVFAMQRLGCEVWPIHTVHLSNHAGYQTVHGEALASTLVDDTIRGLDERGALGVCDAVLSGYAGRRETAEAIVRAAARVRAASPQAVFCCDPVIGDSAPGVYVRADLADLLRDHVVPSADILTPNQFELGFLSMIETSGTRGTIAAIDALHARGPRVVLVTSASLDDTPADAVDILVSADGAVHRVRTPRLAITPNGAGDLLAALFLVHWLRSRGASEALSASVTSLFGVLAHTANAHQREIALIAAQDELVAPTRRFEAQRLA